ncbi:MAG: hypothetical protein WC152_02880 [Candidatus Izemoplasmatales bacterium]
MVLGYFGLIYIIFAIYIIWFSKKKPRGIVAKLIYTFFMLVITLILTSFSFSPKTSFYLKSFPMNLDNEYVQTIKVDLYQIVVFSETNGNSTEEGHDLYVFQKFLLGYVDSGIKSGYGLYENDEATASMLFKMVIIEEKLYFLLFNEELASYNSLIIGGQTVNLDVDLNDKFTLFLVPDIGDEQLTIVLNEIELHNKLL